MQDAVRPLMCHAVDGVGENRDREVASRQHDGAADAALEAAGVAEPLPIADPALDGAEAVVAAEGGMLLVPVPAHHLPAAGVAEHPALRSEEHTSEPSH